ncbi:hypothetical protein [Paenibacillus sp. L3-i20]|uniref:hypothetical protein n=1 Tax=Paenibacillus sp. L3-i20 TaxID=2905833 RepID=UPI00208A4BAB|nr:hypothetical protein [Paenibacillus sp. L3-i20]GKU78021.1 hypothetical protein L3i20_v224180 [Paenibacillus sp. L3-i20]
MENCKEEIKYYQSVLGGEITILRKQGKEVLNADLHVEGLRKHMKLHSTGCWESSPTGMAYAGYFHIIAYDSLK